MANHPDRKPCGEKQIEYDFNTDAVDWNGEGFFPPAGERFEFKSTARGNEPDWLVGVVKYLSDYTIVIEQQGGTGEVVAHPRTIVARPIKTAEQIAAEKKKKWVDSVFKDCPAFFVDDIDVIGRVYDALLSGTLESPRG